VRACVCEGTNHSNYMHSQKTKVANTLALRERITESWRASTRDVLSEGEVMGNCGYNSRPCLHIYTYIQSTQVGQCCRREERVVHLGVEKGMGLHGVKESKS
jgi:hypothetical protein